MLSRALARLPAQPPRPDVLAGLDARDDAAIVRGPPPGHVGVQTVDFFPAFVEDAYLFGAVAANHALGVRGPCAQRGWPGCERSIVLPWAHGRAVDQSVMRAATRKQSYSSIAASE